MDVRAVGVQVLPAEALTGTPNPDDRGLIFAINTHGRWSTAAENEFDVAILSSGGSLLYVVVGVDVGAVTTGAFDGRLGSFVFDAQGNLIGGWEADAPANGSTLLLPVLASQIGLTGADPVFAYRVSATSLQDGALADSTDVAAFTPKRPAVSSGEAVALDPGDKDSVRLTVDEARQEAVPARGWMVVTLDDPNGAAQADLVPANGP
jgi:hypothetical protein